MVARCTRKSRARSAALFRPEPRPSRISAFCSGVSFGWRPPCRPRTAAAFRPARVRSRTMARSNSAKRPSICIRMRPAGPALSIASVSERKRAPTASTLSRMCSRSVSERDRRSSFHTTSGVARPQLIEQAVQLGPVPAPTRRRVLEHPFAAGALERPDLGGGILTVVRLGNPCIVEEHGPVSHFPVANELTLATGKCTRQALAPQPCCINARTPLAKCSGREGGKTRDAGRSERTLGQPSCEAIKVEGRGGRHVLQACLGQPTVARLAQAERAHALRERTLDPLTLGIKPAAGFTLQAGPGGRQLLVFGAWV